MKVSQMMQSPEHREHRTILFADHVGSRRLGATEGEALLVKLIGRLYDVATAAIEDSTGDVVKYQDDAVKAAFSPENATDAINTAIRIQEELARGDGDIAPQCSIGIATGSSISFADDFHGELPVIARHLCLACSAGGILADTATVAAADVGEIDSKIGRAQGRTGENYVGDVQRIDVHSGRIVDYHEIHWAHHLKGLKARFITKSLTG